jgi:hypothetical protein
MATKTGALYRRVKRPGRDIRHSPPSSTKIKNEWIYISTLLHLFRAVQSCIFTFALIYRVVPETLLQQVFSKTPCELTSEQSINNNLETGLRTLNKLCWSHRLSNMTGANPCAEVPRLRSPSGTRPWTGWDCVLCERTGAIDEQNMKSDRPHTEKTGWPCRRSSVRFVQCDSFVR